MCNIEEKIAAWKCYAEALEWEREVWVTSSWVAGRIADSDLPAVIRDAYAEAIDNVLLLTDHAEKEVESVRKALEDIGEL